MNASTAMVQDPHKDETWVDAERQLEAVLDNASVSIFLLDDQGTCSYINAAAEKLTGFSLEEAVGRSLHDLIHHTKPDGASYPENECPIGRAVEEHSHGEETFVHKSGRFFPVAYHASPLRSDGRLAGTIIEVRDISSEKRINDDLRRSLESLQAERHALEVLNETAELISADLNLEGVVQRVVDAGVDLTGAKFGAFFYTVGQPNEEALMLYKLAGARISDFKKFGTPRPTKVFAPTFRGEEVIRSANIMNDPRYGQNPPHKGMPEGHLPVRSYMAVPVKCRSGEVVGGLFFGHPEEGVFTDRAEYLAKALAAQAATAVDKARLFEDVQRANLTLEERVAARTRELEQANETLRHAKKMEAFGQLAGGIAHDFNHVLTVILAAADILRGQELSQDARQAYLDDIVATASRASNLTNHLLAFARQKALQPVEFDAVERLQAVTGMLKPLMGKRIAIHLQAESQPASIVADPHEFETAIVNLCVNAKDAMAGEGELEISVFSAALPGSQEGCPAGDAKYVAISIKDTGTGIEPESIERIFEPFFTTKPEGHGTGLGLSQVFGFVKQSGGEITAESKAGLGTLFTLYLPAPDPHNQS